MEEVYQDTIEAAENKERLKPGSRILYVCDGTDGEEEGITNGVKTTNREMVAQLEEMGYVVDTLYGSKSYVNKKGKEKKLFKTVELPGYPGYRVAVDALVPTIKYIKKTKPDGVFIATVEGPIGFSLAQASRLPNWITGFRGEMPYVASYTTRLDEYAAGHINWRVEQLMKKLGANPDSSDEERDYWWQVQAESFGPLVRGLYAGAEKILVPTNAMLETLAMMGVDMESKGVLWPRGIDSEQYRMPQPGEENPYWQYAWYRQDPKPVLFSLGRVSLEKKIETFLDLDLPWAHKVVIGDGPHLDYLKARYGASGVRFLGAKYNQEKAALIRFGQVMVFSSETDTFGNVVLEAGASGVPCVVSAGANGPDELVVPGVTGFLAGRDMDWEEAVYCAAMIDRHDCRESVLERFNWRIPAEILVEVIKPTGYYRE